MFTHTSKRSVKGSKACASFISRSHAIHDMLTQEQEARIVELQAEIEALRKQLGFVPSETFS